MQQNSKSITTLPSYLAYSHQDTSLKFKRGTLFIHIHLLIWCQLCVWTRTLQFKCLVLASAY